MGLDSTLPQNDCDGWDVYGKDSWVWLHAPTLRSISIGRYDEKWIVAILRHDENGNPIGQLCTFLSCDGNCRECRTARYSFEYVTAEEAFRSANAIRDSIEDECRVEVFPTKISR